jgi:hypothetical protein
VIRRRPIGASKAVDPGARRRDIPIDEKTDHGALQLKAALGDGFRMLVQTGQHRRDGIVDLAGIEAIERSTLAPFQVRRTVHVHRYRERSASHIGLKLT